MAPSELGIESHVRNGAATVRARGEVDLDSVRSLVDAVVATTPPGGTLQIDLSEVGYIDSAGVAGLNRCRRHAQRVDAEVVVVCREASPVAKLLHWTGLARVLDVRAGSSS